MTAKAYDVDSVIEQIRRILILPGSECEISKQHAGLEVCDFDGLRDFVGPHSYVWNVRIRAEEQIPRPIPVAHGDVMAVVLDKCSGATIRGGAMPYDVARRAMQGDHVVLVDGTRVKFHRRVNAEHSRHVEVVAF